MGLEKGEESEEYEVSSEEFVRIRLKIYEHIYEHLVDADSCVCYNLFINMFIYLMRRNTPCFGYGDIRR